MSYQEIYGGLNKKAAPVQPIKQPSKAAPAENTGIPLPDPVLPRQIPTRGSFIKDKMQQRARQRLKEWQQKSAPEKESYLRNGAAQFNKKASNQQIKKLASVLKGKKLIKKASAEQVKKLAHMVGMKKRASGPFNLLQNPLMHTLLESAKRGAKKTVQQGAKKVTASAARVGRGAASKAAPSIMSMGNEQLTKRMGKSLPRVSEGFFAAHPRMTTALKWGAPVVGGTALVGGGYALGSAGKSDLQDALSRTQTQNTQLVKQRNEAKNQSLWEHILRVIGKYAGAGWKALKGAFSAEQGNTASTPNATPEIATKK